MFVFLRRYLGKRIDMVKIIHWQISLLFYCGSSRIEHFKKSQVTNLCAESGIIIFKHLFKISNDFRILLISLILFAHEMASIISSSLFLQFWKFVVGQLFLPVMSLILIKFIFMFYTENCLTNVLLRFYFSLFSQNLKMRHFKI